MNNSSQNKMYTKKNLQKHIFVFLILAATFVFPSVTSAGYCINVGENGNLSGTFGNDASCNNQSGWQLSNPYHLPDPNGGILGIISNLSFWLLAIFSILGVMGFVLSGIFYLTSAGDDKAAEKGKTGMKNSIYGILVGLSGIIIMRAAFSLLDASSRTF